jgi:methionyl-tRNA formyltransferase
MRLVFMGTPDFAAVALKALLAAGHDIACVYSQPPRPAGRGLAPRPSPVHQLASDHSIEVRTPTSLKGAAEQAAFAELAADAAVVVAYGLLLPKPILDAPRMGCFNIHASLLPRWRGAAPIQRAIMAGDAATGISIMRMEEGLDTGPVCARAEVPITARTTAGELHDQLGETGARLMVETLARPQLAFTPQAASGATYARKIDKAEARIDWSRDAAALRNHIHGLSPFPGAWFSHGNMRIKVLRCEVTEGSSAPGTVLDDALSIACGSDALRLIELQREGKSTMDAASFLRGNAIPAGSRLG